MNDEDYNGFPLGSVTWRVVVPMLGISLPAMWAMNQEWISRPAASLTVVGSTIPASFLVWRLYKRLQSEQNQ